MIITKLKGGLGNQLFQYAYGRNLELKGKNILFDISFYAGNKAKTDTARNFKLNSFNIKTKAKFSDDRHPFLDFIDRILIYLNLSDGGFWQSEKYFIDHADIIREEFTLKEPLGTSAQNLAYIVLGAKKNSATVSLHVRRGDVARDAWKNPYYGITTPEYYKNAIEVLAEKIGATDATKNSFAPSIHIFVFSDDIEWVKQNIKIPFPTTFVQGNDIADYEELTLMSMCDHHIIANSSFSWWGAWLNPNPDKIIIAPKQWIRKKQRQHKDICPVNWSRV